MSAKLETLNLPVLEWAPSRVSLFDPRSRQYHSGGSIADVAPYLNGNREVAVALSRRSSFVRTVRVPDAPKEQVVQVLNIRLPGLLPLAPDEIAFDVHLSKNVNEEGRLAVVGAVSCNLLRQLFDDLRSAGLRTKHVAPAAFGSWLLARSMDVSKCAVVDQTAEGLAIDVVADDELRYTRVIPAPKTPTLVDEEINRTFSIAQVNGSQILAAASVNAPNADTVISTRPVETFATGLLTKLDMNIELPEAVQARMRSAVQNRGRLALLFWAAVVCVGALVYTDRDDASKRVKSLDSRQLAQIHQLSQRVAALQGQVGDKQSLADVLTTAFEPAQHVNDVVSAFSNDTPANVWMDGFTFERGKPVVLRGTALNSDSVSAFVQQMSADTRFKDVGLIFINNATLENTPIVQYSIQAHVNGNLPLNTILAKGGQ